MSDDQAKELESVKAELIATRAALQAMKERQLAPTKDVDMRNYVTAMVLFAMAGLVAWQTYLIIQLRGLIG